MVQRLALTSFRHPWRTFAVWLVGLAVVIGAAAATGSAFSGNGHLPGTDSDRAYRLLESAMPNNGADSAQVVVHDGRGLSSPESAAAVAPFLDAVRAAARGGAVTGPTVSADGSTALYEVAMPSDTATDPDGSSSATQVADDLVAAAAAPRAAGVDVELGGSWFTDGEVPASAERIGLIVAVVVLLAIFGSLLAMGVTLLPALLAVAGSAGVVTLVSHLITTPDVTTTVATMIGLGVGIDYGLIIIDRFRRELVRRDPEDALRVAMATAGRAVVLAAGTVAVSLLGMLLVGLDFLKGMSIGAAVAVGVAVLSSISLLPALLRLSAGRMTTVMRRRAEAPKGETFWHRWGRGIAARPGIALAGGVLAIAALAAPAASMRLATADAGNDPTTSTTRRAYDLTASAFGPGANGPLVVVAETSEPTALARVADGLRRDPGVAAVLEPATSPTAPVSAITVIPTTAPQDRTTEALVHRLRDEVIPASGVTAHVGGATASNVDFAELLRRRLPVFIGGVLACSFVLLLLVFRSILVPLKAVLLNLVSIAAAFGATVAVFQWGWFSGPLGVLGQAPIEPWAPMIMFAIVFGLSMDYEVFLLSAIKEHYDRTGDNTEAVVDGLASTARLITGAAAIMVAVFGSFVGAELRGIQLVGFGLAAAVLIDATLVRMVLVPASMELLGDRNWWLPRIMRERLPHLQVEQADVIEPALVRSGQ